MVLGTPIGFWLFVFFGVPAAFVLLVGIGIPTPTVSFTDGIRLGIRVFLLPPSIGIIAALLMYFLAYSWWTSKRVVHLLVEGSAMCGSWVIMQGTPSPERVTCPKCRRSA